MKPPVFLRVLPADVSRLGALEACILAAVRYMTTLTGQANDRRVIDDQTWWRASHDDIVAALGGGVKRRTVTTKVGELIESGDLAAIPAQEFFGHRAKAYRVPDRPSAESDTGADEPLAESAYRIGEIGQAAWPNQPMSMAESADVLSFRDLKSPSERRRRTPIPAAFSTSIWIRFSRRPTVAPVSPAATPPSSKSGGSTTR